MAGNTCNLRELETKLTLRRLRAKGHIYVELRNDGKDGKRIVFYCVLCRCRCYGDSSLFEHLRGKLHRGRYAGAEMTLYGQNPWPFNDGFFFFYDANDHDIAVFGPVSREGLYNFSTYNGEMGRRVSDCGNRNLNGSGSGNGDLNLDGRNGKLEVQGVLWKEELKNLEVKLVGMGKIAVKIDDNYGVADEMISIWCEWLGNNPEKQYVENVPEHDFGIVVFSCDVGLGRNVVGVPSPPAPYSLSEDEEEEDEEVVNKKKKKKKMKSFSDPEEASSSMSRRGGSRAAISAQDDSEIHIRHNRSMSSRALRKKLQREKRLQRIAEQRVCDLCQNRLLPGKDVACLLNMKTRRLACSGSNKTGAFHIFHTSCLVHWILVCEAEIWKNPLPSIEIEMTHRPGRGGTKRRANKSNEKTKPKPHISSAFCPQCHCTGMITDNDQLEKPKFIPLSQLFEHKITVMTKNKAWMEKPEILPNRSTGLRFISEIEEPIQEKVILQKLVRFYRADE